MHEKHEPPLGYQSWGSCTVQTQHGKSSFGHQEKAILQVVSHTTLSMDVTVPAMSDLVYGIAFHRFVSLYITPGDESRGPCFLKR